MIRNRAWTASVSRLRTSVGTLPRASRLLTVTDAIAKSLSIVPDMPSWIQIETTNRCNFSCEMCPRSLHKLPAEDMPLDTFVELVDRLSLPPGSLITLFGLGEPLMHGEILAMVQEVKRRGYEAAFTTNGVLLSDAVIGGILASSLDYLRISVDDDGFGDSGGQLHRAAAVVIERTGALVRMRGALRHPEILWNVVASSASAPSIEGIIDRASEVGIDGVNIINLVPRFSALTPLPEDRRAEMFRQWHLRGRRRGIRIQSTFGDRFGVRRFFHSRGRECPQLLAYAYVTLDGDVTPCCHLPRLVMGNLREQSLREIWHGGRYRHFRTTYRSSPTCRECRLLTWR